MASVFDYIFNIGGNFKNEISGMTDATGRFTGKIEGARDRITGLAAVLGSFDYAKNIIQSLAEGFTSLSSAGVKLDSQMHDLSAVAGVTGEGLKQIETFARQSALAFGTDAAVAVEGYKLLLSQLTPELGKYPEALSAMGDCIQTTSKLMGGDGVAAAQVLTTAMNQYGVSMEDPIAASREMARMMNVMAAAGQAGSAELPAISAALQQCGMAAKAANVSFEETNAAIPVRDTAGKTARAGGVARGPKARSCGKPGIPAGSARFTTTTSLRDLPSPALRLADACHSGVFVTTVPPADGMEAVFCL